MEGTIRIYSNDSSATSLTYIHTSPNAFMYCTLLCLRGREADSGDMFVITPGRTSGEDLY